MMKQRRLSKILGVVMWALLLSACGGGDGGGDGNGGDGGDPDNGDGNGDPQASVACVWGESEWNNCDWSE